MSTPGPARQVTDDEIIAAIKAVEEPFATTREVADRVDLGRQGAYDRLGELQKQGVIESKKAGNGIGWWIA